MGASASFESGLQRAAWGLLPLGCGAFYGLGVSRYLFESQPTRLGFFGAWPGALLTAVIFGAALAFWVGLRRRSPSNAPTPWRSLALLLPAVSVLSPQVNLLRALTLLAGSLILFILLSVHVTRDAEGVESQSKPRSAALSAFHHVSPRNVGFDAFRSWGLGLLLFLLYLRTLAPAVGEADTFEFQVGIARLGIAHGSGYPLLMLVGKLFTLLPVGGTLAFRANLTSAVFGALAGVGAERLARRLGAGSLCSLFAGFAFGVSPTLWARAVEVEAYTLNAALGAAILNLLAELAWPEGAAFRVPKALRLLAFLFGLSLTNHLTTIVLAPACLAAVLIACRTSPTADRLVPVADGTSPLATDAPPAYHVSRITHHVSRFLLPSSLFLLGLSVYLYLPLRWPAVNRGERLTLVQFVNIVTGSEARGAFQLTLPFTDAGRYGIVLRKIVGEYGWAGAGLALVGWLALAMRPPTPSVVGSRGGPGWGPALVLGLAYAGYGYFALAFNVPDPDFSAFLIPLHLIEAVLMGMGLQSILDAKFADGISRLTQRKRPSHTSTPLEDAQRARGASGAHTRTLTFCLIYPLACLLPLHSLWVTLPHVDQSRDWSKQRLGEYMLSQPLAHGAIILADSEKVAPLYYLRVAEGVRPDLDIVVLPDEASYRAALDEHLAGGHIVYLGRYLPGLGGSYSLRSVGPLAEVSVTPFAADAVAIAPSKRLSATLVSNIQLMGYRAEAPKVSPSGRDDLRLTLYWRALAPTQDSYLVGLRLIPLPAPGTVAWQNDGSVPVGRMYPTNAWRPGEVVSDFHSLPIGDALAPGRYRLEAGLFLPFQAFTASGWVEVTEIDILPPSESPRPPHPLRAQLGKEWLVGYAAPESAAPGSRMTITLYWLRTSESGSVTAFGQTRSLAASGWPIGQVVPQEYRVAAPGVGDHFDLEVDADQPARCGWLRPITQACRLPSIQLVGEAAVEGAVNIDNQVLLRNVTIGAPVVTPGGQAEVTLEWQALQTMDENYTVFVHLLSPDGQVYGQVDAWPVSGTLATSQWAPGSVIRDHYAVPVPGDAPPGDYMVEVGLYLLSTLERLPVLDAQGAPVADRVLVAGLTVR